MPKSNAAPVTVPAVIARTQLGSLLREIARGKARYVITRSGKPAAVLLGIQDFDDIVEELDPVFRKSLQVAAKEYETGHAITLRDYLKRRAPRSRARP